ncbi:MAG: hypothetical protein KC731_33125 [Myxococcales bacterium]|nr:hypothetical protein [Myxococcales bacterium]
MRIRALVASLALAALPARAQADDTPHPITLQWDAPPACPDGATVLAET